MASTSAVNLREEMDELAIRGQRIAFGLMTINNVTADHNATLNSVASKLFALVGVSNVLKGLLTVGSRPKDPILPLLGSKDLQDAREVLQMWNVALFNVGPLITDSDNHIYSQRFPGPSTGPPTCHFPEIAMANAIVHTSDCLRGLSLLVSTARIEELRRQLSGKFSNGNNTLESDLRKELYRLVVTAQSLRRQNDRTSVLGTGPPLLQSQPFSGGVFGNQSQAPSLVSLNPSQTYTAVDIKELQHPRGFRGRYGEPDYPFMDNRPFVQLNPPELGLTFEKSFEECELERKELSRKGKYPQPAMFSNWPPVFTKNTDQGLQKDPEKVPEKSDSKAEVTETIEKGLEQTTKETGLTPRLHREVSVDTHSEFEVLSHSEARVNTPGTTRDNTPVPEPSTGTTVKEEVPHQDQKTPTPVRNATRDSNEPRSIKEEVVASVEKAEPEESLEAYMLTPRAEQIHDIVEWSASILKLPLGREQIDAHVKALGEEYSVIDTIATLNPGEWRTIRAYTKPRSGTVVSIQRSHKVTMPTIFGTFDIPSLMFVIKVPKAPDSLRFGNNVPIASEPTSRFGGLQGDLFGLGQTNTQAGGLFRTKIDEKEKIGVTRRPEWEYNDQSQFGARPSGGLFGQPSTTSQSAAQNGFSNTERPGGLFETHQSTGGLFGNPSNRQPSLFNNFSNAQPSLFGNTTSSAVDNTQPQLFSGFNNAQSSPFSNFNNAQPSLFTNADSTQQPRGLFGNPEPSTNGNRTASPFGNPNNTQPPLFGNAHNARPSLFGNAQPIACGNPQPSPFGQLNNNQQTGGLFGSSFGVIPKQPAQQFSCWGTLVSKPASTSTESLFANSNGAATTSNTSSGGFGANFARTAAPNTITTGFRFPDSAQRPTDPTTTANADLSHTKTTDSKEGPPAPSDPPRVNAPAETPSSTSAPSTELFDFEAFLRAPTPPRPAASSLPKSTPHEPQSRPSLFGTPSMPGAENPKPFGTPPSSGPFAQYAGTTSAFVTSVPEKQESVFKRKTSEPVQVQGEEGEFGQASGGSGSAVSSAQTEAWKDPFADEVSTPQTKEGTPQTKEETSMSREEELLKEYGITEEQIAAIRALRRQARPKKSG